MNILDAINTARENDVCIRRPSWPEGKLVFWKNDALHWNQSTIDASEDRLHAFTVESVTATDWETC
jgi:predicted glycosyl hydrolase (DUF1957 family)